MEFGEVGRAAVGHDDAAVTAVIGFAHGGMDTYFCRHSGYDQRFDAAIGKDRFQIGGVEAAFTGFIDDRFPRQRTKLVNDAMSMLAANQE